MREMRRVCRPGGVLVVVNHFHSEHPLGAWLERAISPLANHVGFRMDLSMGDMLEGSRLQLQSSRKVNAFGMWRLLVLRKPGPGALLESGRELEAPLDVPPARERTASF